MSLCYLINVLIICTLVCACTAKISAIDAIGFPEMEENPDFRNKENRQPVYLPAKCPENELLYPGDQKDDWICDCRPAFLYHPTTDSCWPAFRRGPCAADQYLVLQQESVIPVCEKNPCNVDGYVSWNGVCERLGSTVPCNNFPNAVVLGVNATSLVVSCIRLNMDSRFGAQQIRNVTCPLGCKRSTTNKCVPTL